MTPTLDNELLSTFAAEADELLGAIARDVLALERGEGTPETLMEAAFREVHNLKGASRIVGRDTMGDLCQSLESLLDDVRKGRRGLSPSLFDLLHDVLSFMMAAKASEETSELTAESAALLSRLRAGPEEEPAASGAPAAAAPSEQPSPGIRAPGPAGPAVQSHPAPEHTPDELREEGIVRVSAHRLDALFVEAEELVSAKVRAIDRHRAARQAIGPFRGWRVRWDRVQHEVRRLTAAEAKGPVTFSQQSAAELSAFLEWNESFVHRLYADTLTDVGRLNENSQAISAAVDGLRERLRWAVMQPVATVLDIFPKYVRDTARQTGKRAVVELSGREIEVDRRLLEEMKPALVHLVRNSLDHGIERPAERAAAGKPECGTIRLAASVRGGRYAVIEVGDDGAGVDRQAVLSTAVAAGLLEPAESEAASDEQIAKLLFSSGFSTSEVSELSGRGVGLAIVEERVRRRGGSLSVRWAAGEGTVFRLELPLTISTVRGVVARAGDHRFLFPIADVERIARVTRTAIQTVGGRTVVDVGTGGVVRLVNIPELFNVASPARGDLPRPVIVAKGSYGTCAFEMDEILDNQELVVKTLRRPLLRVRYVQGFALLGAGGVIPILHVGDLVSAGTTIQLRALTPEAAGLPNEVRRILVAEDSVTARAMMKSILEAAGYEVKTVIDGVEALAALRSDEFDLVISDVEMPRMGGYELTSRMRGDERLGKIPVVLVTSRESASDKEEGMRSGASAYLPKSGFERGSLLEVVKSLVRAGVP